MTIKIAMDFGSSSFRSGRVFPAKKITVKLDDFGVKTVRTEKIEKDDLGFLALTTIKGEKMTVNPAHIATIEDVQIAETVIDVSKNPTPACTLLKRMWEVSTEVEVDFDTHGGDNTHNELMNRIRKVATFKDGELFVI